MTRVTGTFARGDTVSVVDADGTEIARGLVGLDSAEAALVKGRRSQSVTELLGVGHRSEMIHRDNLVLLKGMEAGT